MGFTALGNRSVARFGLSGDQVQVDVADRALSLAGSDGGSLRILASATERVRFGYFQGKYRRVFNASIWQMGKPQPLVVEPIAQDALAYGAAMREFAQAVAAARGIASLETGISGVAAVMMLIFLMLPPVGLTVTAFVFVDGANWPLRAGMVAMAALLAAAGTWLYVKRQRPRGLERLDQIDAQLPDPVSGV